MYHFCSVRPVMLNEAERMLGAGICRNRWSWKSMIARDPGQIWRRRSSEMTDGNDNWFRSLTGRRVFQRRSSRSVSERTIWNHHNRQENGRSRIPRTISHDWSFACWNCHCIRRKHKGSSITIINMWNIHLIESRVVISRTSLLRVLNTENLRSRSHCLDLDNEEES